MSDALEILKQKIIAFANGDKEYGWQEVVHEGRLFKFPKRALIWYVFGNSTAAIPMLPEYSAFCDIGFKTNGDNPYHSDIWLGAGYCLSKAYPDEFNENDHESKLAFEALSEANFIVEQEFSKLLSFDFTVLANGLPKQLTSMTMHVYESERELPPNTYSSNHIQCQKRANLNH